MLISEISPDLKRSRFVVENRNGYTIKVGKKDLVNFSSNDYLSIASHPAVKKAFIDGIRKYGVGSGSSSLVSGYYRSHQLLEEKFSEFLNRERAILFNSGYLANLGVMTALANRHGKIFADKRCHASILDGIQLSRGKYVRYSHNDINHLRSLITENKNGNIIVTESVFSMEGDIGKIDQIVKIASLYQAMLIVDDAHGIGVLGKNGRGICEHYHLTQNDVPCLVVPLGKAFSSMGAIVSGSHALIEGLIQFSKTYRYTTALPPAIANATIASLKIIENENWRRHKLQALIEIFINQAKIRSLPLISNELTPIKSILIGDNKTALKIKEVLMKNGFFVACIRPPTVPEGTARIRVSLNCMHNEKDIIHLLDLVAACYEQL